MRPFSTLPLPDGFRDEVRSSIARQVQVDGGDAERMTLTWHLATLAGEPAVAVDIKTTYCATGKPAVGTMRIPRETFEQNGVAWGQVEAAAAG
jgi:hypothetical protein